MRVVLFIFIYFSLLSESFGQEKEFLIKTPPMYGGDSIVIPETKKRFVDTTLRETGFVVNRQPVYATTLGQKIRTHYPDFDTVFYFKQKIITRFIPNESYVIVGACCLTTDILPEKQGMLFNDSEETISKKGEWDERKFDSLRGLYYDQPVPIRFSKRHQNSFKNQCAYSPDMAMFPYLVLLEKTKETEWYFIPKGWYRSNFSTLMFFQISDTLLSEFEKFDLDESEEIIEAGYVENVQFDVSISFRFFHGEKIELEYDPKKKKIGIKIIE